MSARYSRSSLRGRKREADFSRDPGLFRGTGYGEPVVITEPLEPVIVPRRVPRVLVIAGNRSKPCAVPSPLDDTAGSVIRYTLVFSFDHLPRTFQFSATLRRNGEFCTLQIEFQIDNDVKSKE